MYRANVEPKVFRFFLPILLAAVEYYIDTMTSGCTAPLGFAV